MEIPPNRQLTLVIIALVIMNGVLVLRWWGTSVARAQYYFLDVGQGDSELMVLPDKNGNAIKILIDGGPDRSVIRELGKILGDDHRIDLLIMSHPQLDHFGGFIDIGREYTIGAFASSDRAGETASYRELEQVLTEKDIRRIVLREGDRIRYGEERIDVLGPSEKDIKSKELNDTAVLLLAQSENINILYTGDIGEKIEKKLLAKYSLEATILKVGHHGSRFSSTATFLEAVNPKVAIIEVGKKNRYGHPTEQALKRLEVSGASVYRTDRDGTIQIEEENGKLKIIKKGRSR